MKPEDIDSLIAPNGQSRFLAKLKELQASLNNEKDCFYLIHTPVGIINAAKWYASYDIVALSGKDENGEYRFLVFSDEDIYSFPIEVRPKTKATPREALGFK